MGCAVSADVTTDEDTRGHARQNQGLVLPPLREIDEPSSENSAAFAATNTSGGRNSPCPFSPATRKRHCLSAPESVKCSREFTSMLPQRLVERDEAAARGGGECPICMTPVAGCLVVTLPCLHIYHTECAVKWLTKHEGSCPECRTRVCAENFQWPPLQLVSTTDISLGGLLHADGVRGDEVNDGDVVRVE